MLKLHFYGSIQKFLFFGLIKTIILQGKSSKQIYIFHSDFCAVKDILFEIILSDILEN